METRRAIDSGSRPLAALALLLGVLACAIQGRGERAVQGWWRDRGPVIPHDSFPSDCGLCHEGSSWRTIKSSFQFDHERETGVALEGAHARAQCLRCHNDRGPAGLYASRGCAGCHDDVHRGELGANCESCHDTTSFRVREAIAVHDRTRFPLIGAHAATACFRCHPGATVGNFLRAPTECAECHRQDLAAASSPDHAALGWVDSCDRCHIPTTWTGGGFNHFAWPLTGAHKQVDCAQCHVGGVFAGTPTQCADCHLGDYNSTTNPNHAALGISTNCQSCHDTSSWLGADFDHAGIVDGCVNCHLGDYQGTSNPNHQAAGFPTTCEQCHDTADWDHGTFFHAFPITSGEHKGFACGQCHQNPNDFTVFSCTHCHAHDQRDMNDEHDDVGGYAWSSPSCYACHPDGKE